MKNDAQNHNKTKDNVDEYVKEKARELFDLGEFWQRLACAERITEKEINKEMRDDCQQFLRQIINDQKVRVSKKRIIEIENLLIDVANGNTGVILASARIQGWLMEAGVEMEDK